MRTWVWYCCPLLCYDVDSKPPPLYTHTNKVCCAVFTFLIVHAMNKTTMTTKKKKKRVYCLSLCAVLSFFVFLNEYIYLIFVFVCFNVVTFFFSFSLFFFWIPRFDSAFLLRVVDLWLFSRAISLTVTLVTSTLTATRLSLLRYTQTKVHNGTRKCLFCCCWCCETSFFFRMCVCVWLPFSFRFTSCYFGLLFGVATFSFYFFFLFGFIWWMRVCKALLRDRPPCPLVWSCAWHAMMTFFV